MQGARARARRRPSRRCVMAHEHYTVEKFLAAIVDGDPPWETLREKSEQCGLCRERLHSARTWTALLKDPAVWSDVERVSQSVDLSAGDVALLRGIIAVEARTKQTASDAAHLLAALPPDDVDAWPAALADVAPSPGFVDALLDAARTYHNREPRDAETILDIAERALTRIAPRAVHLE